MGYTGITVGDRNPIKRYLQRRRLRDAVSMLEGLETFDPVREFASPVDSEFFETEIYQVMKKRRGREANTSQPA